MHLYLVPAHFKPGLLDALLADLARQVVCKIVCSFIALLVDTFPGWYLASLMDDRCSNLFSKTKTDFLHFLIDGISYH